MSRNKLGRRHAFHRPLRLESLERRELLAGNVTARVVGSTLFIQGDSQDNNVGILQVDNGVYAVVGVGETSVNRREFLEDGNPFVTNRPVRNIIVDLGKGNDLLGISNDAAALADLAGELGVDISEFEDAIAMFAGPEAFNLPGNLTIRTGDGSDGVAIVGNVGGSVIANLGKAHAEGGNLFSIDGSTLEAGFARIGGVLSVTGGAHADVVDLADIRARVVSVNTSSGDDSVFLHSHGGEGNEIGTSAIINTGNGHDFVEVANTAIGTRVGILSILTGAGNDGVNLEAVAVATALTINTGAGNDSADEGAVGFPFFEGQAGVVLNDVHVGLTTNINLGAGNDTLDVTASSTRTGLAVGGAGFDRLTVDEDTLDAIDLFFLRRQFEEENLV